jgi:hypothetical protein
MISVCEYIDDFYLDQGLDSVEIDTKEIWGVVGSMIQQFPSPLGIAEASPFKKVAAFTTYFCAQRPIITTLPTERFGLLASHQNAIIAFSLSVDSLHEALLKCPERGDVVLTNRIQISKHFWKDLIVALSGAIPSQHFNCVSLLYESLAYQANPAASYERLI